MSPTSCADLHFDTHANASVYYNGRKGSAFSLDGFEVIAKPARLKIGQAARYSQKSLPFDPDHEPAPAPIQVPAHEPAQTRVSIQKARYRPPPKASRRRHLRRQLGKGKSKM